jgi:hypothetical protein
VAAIKPHLAQDGEASDLQRRYWGCAGGSGLSDAEGEVCPAPEEIVQEAHAELLNVAWIRQALLLKMQDRTVWIQYDKDGPSIAVSKPVGGPAWNPSSGSRATTILGWTTKMGAPSFSLPAGAPKMGGACLGATAGQSVVPVNDRKGPVRRVLEVLNANRGDNPPVEKVSITRTVCEFCLAGDTRVLVRGRGVLRLDELSLDEEFDVWSGQAWRTTKVVFRGVKHVAELQTTWGQRVRGTLDHKFLSDQEMVELSSLEEGEPLDSSLPQESPFPASAPVPVVPVSDAPTALAYRLPQEWSYELGSFLGYVVGDGAITKGKYPSIVIGVGEEDANDLEQLLASVRRWCDTDGTVRTQTAKPGSWASDPKPQAVLNLRIQGISHLLLALGLDKSATPDMRDVPASIWTASHEGVRGFLAGLFGSDGCASVGKSKIEVSLSQVSKPMMESVQQLLFAFGIRSNICEYKSNRERGYLPLWKLSIGAIEHVRRFAELVGFSSSRKQERLLDALRVCDVGEGRRTQPRVRTILQLDHAEPVFDLVNVGPERCFSANGITASNCYAEGGQYATSGVQNAQLMRYAWAERAIERPGHVPGVSEFYSVMLDAIDHADFQYGDEPMHYKSENQRFFRLHDSGDFFSPRYFSEWKKITLYYHHKVGGEGLTFNPDGSVATYGKGHAQPIWFWAPSRVWMLKMKELIARENSTARYGDNFAIRPSAYHINEHGPMFTGDRDADGWCAPSTVYEYKEKKNGQDRAYNWDCKAYAVEKGPSCRGAKSNPKGPGKGSVGCRECWLHRDSAVNYTLHL